DLKEVGDNPEEYERADLRRVGDERGAVEDRAEQAGAYEQNGEGRAAHHRVEEHDVEDYGPTPFTLAREEVEGAHHEAQGQHGRGCADDEERLPVESELPLPQTPHEQERQREAEDERDR